MGTAGLLRLRLAMTLFALCILLAGCRTSDREADEQTLSAGLNALSARNDPHAAAADFRKVLEHAPTHYGARYLLAVVLDKAGKNDEARPLWEAVLAAARASNDQSTAETARVRLGLPASASNEAVPEIQPTASTEQQLMKAGLDALYTRGDPAAAAATFRQVLERNPAHYGAHYQLAVALDRGGKREEARGLWAKVLEMAKGYNDQPTAATAQAR